MIDFCIYLTLAILLARYFPIIKNGGKKNMSLNLSAIKKSYGTNPKRELEGAWFNLSMIDGAKVRVARAGNPEYDKLLRKLYKPYAKTMRQGREVARSVQDEIQLQLTIKTILKDWEGIPDGEGGFIPFTEENARTLLSDTELKELKDEIEDFSNDFAKFQLEMDEDLEKN